MKQKVIIAIGGSDSDVINREIIRLSGKKKPKALFIPTASYDSFRYLAWFEKRFGEDLGCETEVLCLLSEKLPTNEIRRMIEMSDIIYVGGGNTLKMMRKWRFLGVDKMLRKAYRDGKVLCGVSAGAICWFESGHSDSISYYSPKKWDYIRVKGLGLIDAFFCPHFDSDTLGIPREKSFQEMLLKFGGKGIAVDDDAAFCFVDDQVKVISEKKAKGYKLRCKNKKAEVMPIKNPDKLQPISWLFEW